MSQGQGSISYQTPSAGGGGGGTFPAIGARDGLTIESDYVVLGNLATDVGDPAALLDNRRIQLGPYFLDFQSDTGVVPFDLIMNPEAGGVPQGIPLLWTSSAQSFWSAWQPANYLTVYAPGGTAERWYSGYDVYDGVNPDSPRPNVVGMWWGYNTGYNQAPVTAGEAAFRYATETFYEIDDDYYFEFHTPEITTTGDDIFRLDSTYVSRTTGIGFREWVINDWTVFDTTHNPSGGYFYSDLTYNVGADNTRLTLRSQLTDGTTEIVMGNWTDGNITIVYQQGNFYIDGDTLIQLSANTLYLTPYGAGFTLFTGTAVMAETVGGSPGGGALLDLQSTTLGFSPPKMTTAQRNAIATSSATALVVFVTDIAPNGKLSLWTGVSWEVVTSV
jgi:hypothetical protein